MLATITLLVKQGSNPMLLEVAVTTVSPLLAARKKKNG